MEFVRANRFRLEFKRGPELLRKINVGFRSYDEGRAFAAFERNLEPAGTESVAGNRLAARGFDGMRNVGTPFDARVITPAIDKDAELPIRRWSELKANCGLRILDCGLEKLARVADEMMFRAS